MRQIFRYLSCESTKVTQPLQGPFFSFSTYMLILVVPFLGRVVFFSWIGKRVEFLDPRVQNHLLSGSRPILQVPSPKKSETIHKEKPNISGSFLPRIYQKYIYIYSIYTYILRLGAPQSIPTTLYKNQTIQQRLGVNMKALLHPCAPWRKPCKQRKVLEKRRCQVGMRSMKLLDFLGDIFLLPFARGDFPCLFAGNLREYPEPKPG